MVFLPLTLDGAHEWYRANSVSCHTVELCDMHVKEKSPGILEYTVAIYDACPSNLYQNMCLAPYLVFGDVLVFKTTVSRNCFDDMVDNIEMETLGFQEIWETVSRFYSDLRLEFGMDLTKQKLFPQLFGSQVKKKTMYHATLPTPLPLEFPSNIMPLDLLTWGMKYRGFTEGVGILSVDPSRTKEGNDAFNENRAHAKNDIGICFICKGLCRKFCSRCLGYYWCGAKACKKEAWKAHKASCKASSPGGAPRGFSMLTTLSPRGVMSDSEVNQQNQKLKAEMADMRARMGVMSRELLAFKQV